MRLNGFFKRDNSDFICITRHSFAHIECILCIFVGPSRIIPEDTAVDYISQTLVHVYRNFIRWPDKQVHEPPIMSLDCDFLQVIHQTSSESLSSELWGDCHSGDVTVPILFIVTLFVAFNFSE